MISFRAVDFTRVFGILGHAQGGRKISSKPKKLDWEVKAQLVELVCGKLSEVESEALMGSSKGGELKKSDVQGHWRCLMDLVKSRLTSSSRASNISFLEVTMMNDIMNGRVYDWAFLLVERMNEFMRL